MNKEIIICMIIIIFIIIINVVTINYTENAVETIGYDLNMFKELLLSDNFDEEKIEIKNKEINEKWDEKYNVLAYFIEHDELEKVETELVALKASIIAKEYDDGIENLERCIFILNHIKDKYVLKLKNIF